MTTSTLNSKHKQAGREEQIRKLSEAGLTERQIAKALGISKTTVHYWLTKAER